VPSDDEYVLRLRVAAVGSSGGGQVAVGGTALASFSVPATGGWQSWRTIDTTVPLEAGDRERCASAWSWKLERQLARPRTRDRSGLPRVARRIEAEDYDDMVGIKTEIVLNEDAGIQRRLVRRGRLARIRWSMWRRRAATRHRCASLSTAHLPVVAADSRPDAGVLWSFSVPATGGWQSWQTITGQVDLPTGKRLLRLYVEKALESELGWNSRGQQYDRNPVTPQGTPRCGQRN